jgi:uncharacterized protein (TIGR02271 family)
MHRDAAHKQAVRAPVRTTGHPSQVAAHGDAAPHNATHLSTLSNEEERMATIEEVKSWRGATLVDRDGEKIGKVEDIYLDRQTGQPEWVAVKTGLIGSKLSFVPLAQADRSGDEIQVPYEKAQVKDAPSVEADGELSQDEESQLYQHYGLDYDESRSDSGLPAGGQSPTSGKPGAAQGDDAMTRSEEELRVGKESRQTGVARLKKYVVTEDVQTTVPVEREEVRVEREPITDENVEQAMSGSEITESEHEVTLHQEEPVVEKRTVPKERVQLSKDKVAEEREVSEEVRKERIETEDDH